MSSDAILLDDGRSIDGATAAYLAPEQIATHVFVFAHPARLSALLAGFERETGHQFAVALFESLDGENLEQYSTALFRAWKLGDSKRNDGLLLALFRQDRLWRDPRGFRHRGIADCAASRSSR